MNKFYSSALAKVSAAAVTATLLAGCSAGGSQDTLQSINSLDWDIVCTTSDCQTQLNEAFLTHRTNYTEHAEALCTVSNGANVTIAHPWAPYDSDSDNRNLIQKAAGFLDNESGTAHQLSLLRLTASRDRVHIHRETGEVLQPGQESRSGGTVYGIQDINEYLQGPLKERYDAKYVMHKEFGDIIFWDNQGRTYRAESYAFDFAPSEPTVVTSAPDTSSYLTTTIDCANHYRDPAVFDNLNTIDYSNANVYRLATREDWRFNGPKWDLYANGKANGEYLDSDEFDTNYNYDPVTGLYTSNKTFKVLQSPWESDTPITLQDGSRIMVSPGQWLVNDGTGTVEVLSDTEKQLKFELAK